MFWIPYKTLDHTFNLSLQSESGESLPWVREDINHVQKTPVQSLICPLSFKFFKKLCIIGFINI